MLDPETQSDTAPEPEASPRTAATAGDQVVRDTLHAIRRAFLAVLGAFLIIIGVPIAIATPFPFVPIGLPIVISGVVLLGMNSTLGRKFMEAVLAKWPMLEKFAPHWLMRRVFGREKRVFLRKSKDPNVAKDV